MLPAAWLLGLLACLVTPGAASAQSVLPPDDAAVRAAAVVESSCRQVQDGSVVNAAAALGEVSEA